jgi:hypothetical protein
MAARSVEPSQKTSVRAMTQTSNGTQVIKINKINLDNFNLDGHLQVMVIHCGFVMESPLNF